MLAKAGGPGKESLVLIFSVFIAGLCSIIYELLIGTTTSYFLGDSIKQFSLTIGFYMAAMGLGSFLSRYIKKNVIQSFIGLEIALALIGGLSVPLLYLAFAYTDWFGLLRFVFIIAIGILIGLEIPLLTRLMDRYYTLKINISNILSLDYCGALLATLLFPFILLPFIGTFKSSLVFGLINMLLAFVNLWAFREALQLKKWRFFTIASFAATFLLAGILISSQSLLSHWHAASYQDRVIFAKQSPYQSIVVTKHREDIRLYLNGSLQFSSIDEYRYHESLAHIPMSLHPKAQRVLILGGGDGLLARELLKYDRLQQLTLVDLDPAVTDLATSNPYLTELNQHSLEHSQVSILHTDAFVYLSDSQDFFDIIIADLPDPSNASLARLYSREFYALIKQRLRPQGVFATQATSPFFAKDAFWCIYNTIQSSGFRDVRPYHVNVPSFAEWGFVVAANRSLAIDHWSFPVETRFIDATQAEQLFRVAKDLSSEPNSTCQSSSLEQPMVLSLYLAGWQYWN